MSIETSAGPWKPVDSLANRILLVRNTTGMSQREFALRAGVTFGVIQGIEKGRSPRGETDVIKRVAAAFDVDRDWLMWGGALNEEVPSGDGPEGQSAPGAGAGRKSPSNL